MLASSLRVSALVLGLLALSFGTGQALHTDTLHLRQRTMVEVITTKLAWAKKARRPAILLGGGSNVLTGLQAALLSETLHRPAYNLGLTSEGDDYRNGLALLEASALPGDTIIYASRGFHMSPAVLENPIKKQSGDIEIRVARTQGVIPQGSVLREMVTYNTIVGPWYSPENYNTSGDFTLCLGPKFIMPEQLPAIAADRSQFVTDLADFSARLNKCNVHVFFLAPDIYEQDSDVPGWVAAYEKFHNKLERAGAQWLDYPEQDLFVTRESEFCGAGLHPTPQHAAAKTRWLAQQLTSRL